METVSLKKLSFLVENIPVKIWEAALNTDLDMFWGI